MWLQDLEPGSFDTITCFSVTKWVHLNGGDEALQALLAKVYSLLAPGGRYILEPQQWVSYRKALRKPVSSHLCASPTKLVPARKAYLVAEAHCLELLRYISGSGGACQCMACDQEPEEMIADISGL